MLVGKLTTPSVLNKQSNDTIYISSVKSASIRTSEWKVIAMDDSSGCSILLQEC